jgi:hypothetical protein
MKARTELLEDRQRFKPIYSLWCKIGQRFDNPKFV